MNYEYASIPTRYRATEFRSRLEARWAAFADLAGWKWKYEPVDLNGWIPDFWFGIPCGHSECCLTAIEKCPLCQSEKREILYRPVLERRDPDGMEWFREVPRGAHCSSCAKEYALWDRDPNFLHELYAEVKPYSDLKQFDGHPVTLINEWEVPAPARFGLEPSVTEWCMAHGAGGGIYSAADWCDGNVDTLWEEAGNLTRYKNWRTL